MLKVGNTGEFLNHLKESKKKVKILTTFGSADTEDVYLYGYVDYVGANYIVLKNAYINNHIAVEDTYFSLKNNPGEAIIFEQDIYSLYVLEEDDKEKNYQVGVNIQGMIKIKAKNNEELKVKLEEKISKLEQILSE